MPHTIEDLRTHLFETLNGLRDKEHPMDLDRAKAVADVARVVIDSAKVEVHFLEVTGAIKSTGFLPEAAEGHGDAQKRLQLTSKR